MPILACPKKICQISFSEKEIEYLPEIKVAQFKPIDSWRGLDLKASFNSFRKKLP
jgi:hypothetical protein